MRAEQVANYLHLGALRGRLHQLTAAALLVIAWTFVGLMFDTAESVYKGTGALRTTQEHPVQAEVVNCQRVGPVSANGLGYWSGVSNFCPERRNATGKDTRASFDRHQRRRRSAY